MVDIAVLPTGEQTWKTASAIQRGPIWTCASDIVTNSVKHNTSHFQFEDLGVKILLQ